jgi:DegV family protein with EDD domain
VEVISLCVSLGDELYRDGVDIQSEDIFAYVSERGTLPKTSAISVGEYEKVFRKYTEQGYQIVHINLSSNLSSCYQNALIAAKEVGGVYPVDSLNLSTGSGHLVIEAANMAKKAMTAEEIVEKLCKMREKLDVSFVLQTLDYLRKGGRCSALTALGANLLQLRPEIEVKDGKMGVGNKYRGKMDKSISDYVKGRLEGRTDLVLERIFVTHSGVPAEIVSDVMAQVKQLQPFSEVIETRAGCTITSHCGPNCLGVLFFKK